MKCRLCKNKDADQTGSHITSAFLLSSQIGKRGEERGFLITTNPEQDYSENKGDQGIKEDYIFCRDCEKRLGVIENLYAIEITHKIEQKQYEQNFEKIEFDNDFYKLHSKRLNSIVFQLLIQSNIWRASISNQPFYNHFKLNNELEEQMRFNLDLFLPQVVDFKIAQSTKDWLNIVHNCNDLFDFIPISVIKAENIENKEMTYEFFDNISNSPYHIILNEYFLLVFNENKDWTDNFFDLKEDFDIEKIINDKYEEPKIGIVTNERYFQTINKIKDLAVKQRLMKIEKQSIDELYRHGIPITPETVRQMVMKKVNEIKM